MNKKKKLIIISIIIILLIAILLFKNNNTEEKLEKKLFPAIKERLDKEDSFMILVTNNNPDESLKTFCLHCASSLNFIKYNKELYNLDILTYDKDKYSVEDYNNVEDYLELEKNFIIPPAIIYVIDGKWAAIENEIRSEHEFKEYLVKYNYIKDSELTKEVYLDNKEEFDKIYSNDKNNIVILYSIGNNINKIRKELYEISLKKSFTYYMVCIDIMSSQGVSRLFIDRYDDYNVPSIAVIGNNKIIDYTSNIKEKNIEKFILKYINS